MKVVTLDSAGFAAACTRLEQAAAGFAPDMIVGIASGGVCVAQRMFAELPHAEVECHREGSAVKRSNAWLFAIIRRMPVFVRNRMRILEAKMLSGRRARSTSVAVSDSARLAISGAGRILVVDDAVDSGNTLAAVLAEIKALRAPGAAVASAVITVTTDCPAVQPDYTLFNNQTLIRFPWSMDA